MLPIAGLYLPQSLHRSNAHTLYRIDEPALYHHHHDDNDEPALYSAETESASPRSLPRRSRQSKHEETEIANQDPTLLAKKPESQESSALPSLQTMFIFADFVSILGKTSTETQLFANLIHGVRKDDAEASRLYSSPAVREFMNRYPDQRAEFDVARGEVRRALNDIGAYVEAVQVGGDDERGPAAMKRRFEWILNNQKKLVTRQLQLAVCYQRLTTAIRVMEAVERCCGIGGGPVYEAPVQPWIRDRSQYRPKSPYSRRPRQRNMSMSSIGISETEEDYMDANSAVSLPAELPEKTPASPSYFNARVPNTWTDFSPHGQYQTTPSSSTNELDCQHTYLNRQPDIPTLRQTPSHNLNRPLPQLPMNQQGNRMPFRQASLRAPQTQEQQALPSTPCRSSYPNTQESLQPRPTHDTSSLENTHRLPTVTEKPLQHTTSTASTSTTRRSRRYRPPSFTFQPPHSTTPPSTSPELPSLQTRSSLVDDLARWMSPRRASAALNNPTEDAHSPSTSSPAFALPSPATTLSSDRLSSSTFVSSPEFPPALSLARRSCHDAKRTASLQSTSSTVARKPVPCSAADGSGPVAASRTAWSDSSEVGGGIEAGSEISCTDATVADVVSGDDEQLSLLQQRLLKQDYVDQVPELTTQSTHNYASPDQQPTHASVSTQHEHPAAQHFTIEVPATCPPPTSVPLPSSPATSFSGSIKTVSSSTQSTPMTAQAKRRAALVRRMERDFGK